jgi:hypothetical protein
MVDANMTRRRRIPIENDLQNDNHPDGIIESNSPTDTLTLWIWTLEKAVKSTVLSIIALRIEENQRF